MTSQGVELPLQVELPPLRVDQGGVVRVGNSRISLDLIVEQYENGMIAEDMVVPTIRWSWQTSTPFSDITFDIVTKYSFI